jgi:uncharacterized spore protein YtfJ
VDAREIFERAGEHLAVTKAFGSPVEHEGSVVVPVAVVAGGGGGGVKDAENSGGGFGGLVYPVGAYVLRAGEVRFVPTFDMTLLVAGLLALARLVVKRRRRASS